MKDQQLSVSPAGSVTQLKHHRPEYSWPYSREKYDASGCLLLE